MFERVCVCVYHVNVCVKVGQLMWLQITKKMKKLVALFSLHYSESLFDPQFL